MEMNMRKEQFSQAYVQAVAACAGFAWCKPSVDDDSVDLSLFKRGGGGTVSSPRLELQLKCMAADTPNGDSLAFPLTKKNYDDLRDGRIMVPRILVVVLVPEDHAEWLGHSETELAMRRCGYWMSLKDFPESDNETSQTVNIPRKQQFTAPSLQEIMNRVGQGGSP